MVREIRSASEEVESAIRRATRLPRRRARACGAIDPPLRHRGVETAPRQGTLYASPFPARVRYSGLSTVYQLSGVYASGLTPLILTALIGAAGGSPWLACSYLVATALVAVVATLLLEPMPLADL